MGLPRHAVILAGGSGTRFWPLSRVDRPKQLLNLSGRDALLNETLRRIEPLIPLEDCYVVTADALAAPLDSVLLPGLPRKNVLYEPTGRNTAPCVLYAAMHLLAVQGDGILCVFPSDHHIADAPAFRDTAARAAEAAETSGLVVTIGIGPTYPATGYGYIRTGEVLPGPGPLRRVERFVEKPDLGTARDYLSEGGYLWNGGMFFWKASLALEAFRRHLPRLYRAMEPVMACAGTDRERDALARAYAAIDPISFDKGILERSDDVGVLSGDFGWSDIGSWDSLSSLFPPDAQGNIVRGDHVGFETDGCVLFGKDQLIATVGLQDTIVVATPDAVLVCPKDRAQDIRRIVESLRDRGRTELL